MDGKRPSNLSRRDFIDRATRGLISLGALPVILAPGKENQGKEKEKTAKIAPHPNVSPLRVVGIHDPEMTRDREPVSPWKAQEKLVRPKKIHENMDRLACALTGEKRPGEAWKALFIKPPGKSWGEVTVAIKTNNIADQHTRSPVLVKLCKVLTKGLGVKAEKIFIYDACHGKDMLRKTPFTGLPEGVHVASTWGGFAVEAPVGRPWKDGSGKALALPALVKGEVDILVNVALCKGHSPTFGAFTMCMKNHFGTFTPRPHGHSPGATDYLIAINRSPLLLGDLDEKGRKIAFPRQQLCMVDALWASEKGPGGNSSVQPNRLFMGTLPATLDYLVAHEFRVKTMGWKINEPVVRRFLEDFGYDPAEASVGGIVDAMGAA